MGFSGLLRGLLYQRPTLDAGTYALAALVLGLIAIFACWLPARRAAVIDPVRTLRAE